MGGVCLVVEASDIVTISLKTDGILVLGVAIVFVARDHNIPQSQKRLFTSGG